MVKRILIVDDEENVVFFLAENLIELGAGYEIETACSGPEALACMVPSPFDLVITDLRMPGMDGLMLIKRIRARYPQTRLILMTAYGDAGVETTAYRLGACRYIAKPFAIEELIAQVRLALDDADTPGQNILMLTNDQFDAIARCLADLRFEVGAQCILLADVTGQLVAHVGETEGLDLPTLVSLVGGGFATAFEMARYLEERNARTLNYHEGERYDIYSSNVNESLFVVLVFDKHHQQSRVGMVWLYTRRALKQLESLARSAEKVDAGRLLDADFGAQLSDGLDQLLTVEADGIGWEAPKAEEAKQAQPKEEETEQIQPTEVAPPPAQRTFSLQQALEMGLLDPTWLNDELDR